MSAESVLCASDNQIVTGLNHLQSVHPFIWAYLYPAEQAVQVSVMDVVRIQLKRLP
jgi:hypothetical protein